MKALLTPPQLAGRMRVTRQHIWKLCREGAIPHHRIGGAIRFDPAEIDAWLAANRRGPDVIPPASHEAHQNNQSN